MINGFYCRVVFKRGLVWVDILDPDKQQPAPHCWATSRTVKRFKLVPAEYIYTE